MVSAEVLSVGTVILSVFLSTIGSIIVARWTIKSEAEVQRERRREEWYRKASIQADRTEDDWWEVMTSGEASYEIVPHEHFTKRRDAIEEHVAEGKTLAVDEEVVHDLGTIAANLNLAASSDKYPEIEKEILPVIDSVREVSQEHIGEEE